MWNNFICVQQSCLISPVKWKIKSEIKEIVTTQDYTITTDYYVTKKWNKKSNGQKKETKECIFRKSTPDDHESDTWEKENIIHYRTRC